MCILFSQYQGNSLHGSPAFIVEGFIQCHNRLQVMCGTPSTKEPPSQNRHSQNAHSRWMTIRVQFPTSSLRGLLASPT